LDWRDKDQDWSDGARRNERGAIQVLDRGKGRTRITRIAHVDCLSESPWASRDSGSLCYRMDLHRSVAARRASRSPAERNPGCGRSGGVMPPSSKVRAMRTLRYDSEPLTNWSGIVVLGLRRQTSGLRRRGTRAIRPGLLKRRKSFFARRTTKQFRAGAKSNSRRRQQAATSTT
jgi:hypothetical protein